MSVLLETTPQKYNLSQLPEGLLIRKAKLRIGKYACMGFLVETESGRHTYIGRNINAILHQIRLHKIFNEKIVKTKINK